MHEIDNETLIMHIKIKGIEDCANKSLKNILNDVYYKIDGSIKFEHYIDEMK